MSPGVSGVGLFIVSGRLDTLDMQPMTVLSGSSTYLFVCVYRFTVFGGHVHTVLVYMTCQIWVGLDFVLSPFEL